MRLFADFLRFVFRSGAGRPGEPRRRLQPVQYSYIPLEEEIVGSAGAWAVARSDEATYSNYQWVYYNLYRSGNYSSSTPNGLANFGFWDRFYIAINQCTIFLNNIDKDKQDDPKEIEMMKGIHYVKILARE